MYSTCLHAAPPPRSITYLFPRTRTVSWQQSIIVLFIWIYADYLFPVFIQVYDGLLCISVVISTSSGALFNTRGWSCTNQAIWSLISICWEPSSRHATNLGRYFKTPSPPIDRIKKATTAEHNTRLYTHHSGCRRVLKVKINVYKAESFFVRYI